MSSPQDPIATAQGLTTAVQALAGEVSQLRKYGRNNRRFVVVDIALTVLLSGVGALSVHAAQAADQAQAAQLALCKLGNESRAEQLQIWTHVIALSAAGKTQTAQQKETAAAFRVYLGQAVAPRDCARIATGKAAGR